MNLDLLKDHWKKTCNLLFHDIRTDICEEDFEKQILKVIKLLGWYENKGEIKRKLRLDIGRNGALTPDIIIYDEYDKALIVIEVKRPAEDLSKDDKKIQLKSYMRQLKTEFGLLIGNQIHLYYDGHLNTNPEPLMLEKYDFYGDFNKGIEFVRFFNKTNFNSPQVNSYVERLIGKIKNKRSLKNSKKDATPKQVCRNSERMERVFCELIPELEKLDIEYKVNHGKESVTFNIGDYFKLFLSPRDNGLYTLAIFSKIRQVSEALKDFRFSVEPNSTNNFRRARIPMVKLDKIVDSIRGYYEKITFA